MMDALLLVDVINDFRHEDGDKLLESFRERHGALVSALEEARAKGVPVIYANDNFERVGRKRAAPGRGSPRGRGRRPRPTDRARPRRPLRGQAALLGLRPQPLVLILRELEIERILLAGAATEMCVVQTAIDAKEEGFKVSILADACATTDPEIEELALRYAEEIVGAFVER